MRRSLVLCFAALFLTTPVASAANALPASRAKGHELLVSTAWLEQHLRDANLTVVEIGDPEKFAESHVAGARFIAAKDLVVKRGEIANELPDAAALATVFGEAGLPDRGRIVIYAREMIPAARAFFTLEYAGRRGDCALLDGMFAKWSSEKRPVQEGPPASAPTTFTVRVDPGVVVAFAPMKILVAAAAMSPAQFAIVDARPAVNFTGTEPGEDITRGGHIPSAVNVPHSANSADGVFRPPNELSALYRNAGVADSATIITYCRTGMQASVDYFVLRYLGRTVHLYDGSYSEWSAAADTQVAK
jgi:thiosulfate/3-mercaptopyruvate sulfurtransferase